MAESFFTDGEAYERFMGRWSRAAGEQFIDWLAVPVGQKWVDVGCGTGAFTELVLARCKPATIDAIDPAEDQIAFARRRPGAVQASFRAGDAQSLPYGNQEFDAAALALVINFIPDPAKAMKEVARVLKPGGIAGAYIWNFAGDGFVQQPLRIAIAAMNVALPPNPGEDKATIDAMRRFFETAGFERIESRTIEIEVSYASFDEYWESQTGLPNPAVQALRKMSDADVTRLKNGLRERLAGPDGRIRYGARANAVKGRVPQ
jgi:ubiquinone/menaquinone biosynthesis C-methylase UbiE